LKRILKKGFLVTFSLLLIVVGLALGALRNLDSGWINSLFKIHFWLIHRQILYVIPGILLLAWTLTAIPKKRALFFLGLYSAVIFLLILKNSWKIASFSLHPPQRYASFYQTDTGTTIGYSGYNSVLHLSDAKPPDVENFYKEKLQVGKNPPRQELEEVKFSAFDSVGEASGLTQISPQTVLTTKDYKIRVRVRSTTEGKTVILIGSYNHLWGF